MTASPTPPSLAQEFSKTIELHDQLDSISTEADAQLRSAIATLRSYREVKQQIHSFREVDYGLVTEMCLELELVIKLDD